MTPRPEPSAMVASILAKRYATMPDGGSIPLPPGWHTETAHILIAAFFDHLPRAAMIEAMRREMGRMAPPSVVDMLDAAIAAARDAIR